jgi:excisionase family DNA binding protein
MQAVITERQRRTLTISEAAQELGMSESKVRQWVRTGTLPSVQLSGHGGRILIPRAALERILEDALGTPALPAGGTAS